MEKTAITYHGGDSDDESGASDAPRQDLTSSSIGQNKTANLFFDEINSLPSTPPGSIRSNQPLPSYKTEEEYKREVTHETYNQILIKMERGKLHDKDYKSSNPLPHTKTWVHPPTNSSPPRRVAEKRPRPAEPLAHTLQDINVSLPITELSHHRNNSNMDVHEGERQRVSKHGDGQRSSDIFNATHVTYNSTRYALRSGRLGCLGPRGYRGRHL